MGVDLSAAVLVGGRSRRMGTDKARLRLVEGGPTVLETVVARLREVSDDVMLVGKGDEDCLPGTRQLADQHRGIGAIGGIHAALKASRASHVLVVGCDMPFLQVGLLRYMASLMEEADVVVPVPDRPQPLHAIYSRDCLPVIEASIDRGDFKASGWFEEVRTCNVRLDVLRVYDPAMLSWFNMNTPEDLDFARSVMRDSLCPDVS